MKPWEEFQQAQQGQQRGPWEEFQQPAAPNFDPLMAQNQRPVSALEKIGMGMRDPLQGGAQFLTKLLPDSVVSAGDRFNNWLADKTGLVGRLPEGGVDQQTRDMEREYQSRRASTGDTGVDWWRMAGNVASPANIAIGSRIPALTGLGARMLAGGAASAAGSALAPVTEGDYWDTKATQAGTGAAIGAAIPFLTGGLARMVSPKASTSPDVAAMKAAGVKPTVGQVLGGGFNVAEERAQSIPLFGDAISMARQRARDQFNEATVNKVLAPIGKSVNKSGVDAVKQASGYIDDAYDAARNAMNFKLDQQGVTELTRLRQMAGSLGEKELRTFDDAWQRLASEVSPNGSITSEGYKRFDSYIGKEATRFANAADGYQNKLGEALRELGRIVQENGRRSSPQAKELFDKADAAYAQMVRLEGAARSAKLTGGNFTPGQLMGAVDRADKSLRGKSVARGDALMQDWALSGQKVLGSKVPDSGTAGRIGMGVGTLGAAIVDPIYTGAVLGGGALAYTPALQGLLRGAVSSRPQGAEQVSDFVRNAYPYLVPGAAQIGTGLLGYQGP